MHAFLRLENQVRGRCCEGWFLAMMLGSFPSLDVGDRIER